MVIFCTKNITLRSLLPYTLVSWKNIKQIKSYKSLKKNFFLNFWSKNNALFFCKKRVKKFLSNDQNFFTKICFGKSFKACASLIEKHNVNKKSKHLKRNIIFKFFEFVLRNFVNIFPKDWQLKNFCKSSVKLNFGKIFDFLPKFERL